jgi:cytochrome c biogenesis factor
MAINDLFLLLHPFLAIVVLFPLLAIVLERSILTRKRRIQTTSGERSSIAAAVGSEHLRWGKIFAIGVILITLMGLCQPIFSEMIAKQAWQKTPFRLFFIITITLLTGSSAFILERAFQKKWRIIFAVLTIMGIIVLGSQPEIYKRSDEWYISHYYIGILAAIIMVVSLTIISEIYRDRTQRFRYFHIILNSFAVLLFLAQGFTGARDLLEIPLTWQKPFINTLYEKSCQTQPCKIDRLPPQSQSLDSNTTF